MKNKTVVRTTTKGVPSKPESSTDQKLIERAVLGFIIAVTAIIYWKTLKYGIVQYDDASYMMNEQLKSLSWKNISAIFSSFYLGNYHPLVTLTWAVLNKFFRPEYGGHHALSLIFHLANTVLVYVFFKRISGKLFTALFISAIFAVHPLNVESVAWIAELKNVMYSFFFLLGMISYWSYLQKGFRIKYLIYAGIFLLLSLFSKSAAVVLPLVFFAMDLYAGRRISIRTIGEKLPFLALSFLFGLLALFSQDSAIMTTEYFTIGPRILYSFYGLAFYFVSFFLPYNQSVMHVFPVHGNAPVFYYFSIPAVLIVVVLLLILKKNKKEIRFGMLFYFINLLMVLQVVSFGSTVVAERYAYLPMLGILFILATYIEKARESFSRRNPSMIKAGLAALVAVFLVFSYLTHQRAKIWKDSVSLFTDAIKADPDNFIAHMCLGDALALNRDFKGAYASYTRSIKVVPSSGAYSARGKLMQKTGRLDAALIDLDSAVYYSPFSPAYLYPLGIAQVEKKEYRKAMRSFLRGLESVPTETECRLGYAYCLLMTGQLSASLSNYFVAYYNTPNDPFIPFNIGVVYQKMGVLDTACSYIRKAADMGYPQAQQYYQDNCMK